MVGGANGNKDAHSASKAEKENLINKIPYDILFYLFFFLMVGAAIRFLRLALLP